jgi:ABC-type phosphate/phosphonate transport system substrate-binding protein
MRTAKIMLICCIVSVATLVYGISQASQFRIAIMQDERGAAAKFRPLENYLKSKGIDFTFVAAKDYPAAAKMFASGEVDAMFSGSSVAGIFILKDLASPLVRPLTKEGTSTYHAVLIAPAGSPKFTGQGDYFKGKKVIFTALASSGEIFYHSVPGTKPVKATLLKAASHGAAIDALSAGSADVAIVKNHVWEKAKAKYPKLTLVGKDDEENPDGTLIVSKKADAKVVLKVSAALLEVKDDPSAKAVRDELGIKGYIKTTPSDFKHTMELLKRAGVDKSFNFSF